MTVDDIVKRNGGITNIAKMICENGGGVSEHEFSDLIMAEARTTKRDNESDAQAFARLFADADIQKAYAIVGKARSVYDTVNVKPIVTGGGRTDVESDAPYEKLKAMAEKLAAQGKYRSVAQAFEAVFTDPSNVDLARASLGR